MLAGEKQNEAKVQARLKEFRRAPDDGVNAFVSEHPNRLDRQVVTCLSLDMADVFEALAAPARRAILDELTARNGQTLFEICARLTMKHGLSLTRQAVSQHLALLEAAGLITTRREGRYKFHFLDTTPFVHAIVKRWLKPERKAGDP